MLDPATGALRFDGGGVELSPTLSRAAFLETRFGESAKVVVENGPYCSWRLTDVSDPPRRFMVTVYFKAERLFQVHVADSNPEFGTSWDDWSVEREKARHVSHEAWLRNSIGEERAFDWGTVEAILDLKTGDACIVVTYGQGALGALLYPKPDAAI